ncbi:MAG: DUF2339 domain-containing protein [Candidatus Omnitrophica bacterium]|nr:DUF2339 domain-containing protein [Candidatus Omnitrophota bacterium]
MLFYLTTYAMHYIPATRIIIHPTTEILLLTLVSAAAIFYNLQYRSGVVTALTFFLGFFTVSLGGLDFSSIFYWILLTGGLAYVAWRFHWLFLLICGILGSYFVITLLILSPNGLSILLGSWIPHNQFPFEQIRITIALLGISWLVYTLALIGFRSEKGEEGKLCIIGILINACLFIFLERQRIEMAGLGKHFEFVLFSGMAGIYFLLAYLHRRMTATHFSVIYAGIAFFLLGMAGLAKLPALGLSYYWLLETVLLFVLGVYYREQIFRVMSLSLALIVTFRLFLEDWLNRTLYHCGPWVISHDVLIFSLTAASFYFLGLWVRNFKSQGLPANERSFYEWSFSLAGTLLLAMILSEKIADRWISLAWLSQGVGILTFGLLFQSKVYRRCALGMLMLVAARVLFVDMSGANTIYRMIVFLSLGGVLVGISFLYSHLHLRIKDEKDDS